MSEQKLWTEDLGQLFNNGKWKDFLPWDEAEEDAVARNNATARLILYITGISLLLRRNPKFVKYGLGSLAALAIFQKKPPRDEPQEKEQERVEVQGGIFDSDGVNLRVNTIPDVSDILEKVKHGDEVRFRKPKIPTREEQIYGVRQARKSHSTMKDSLYEPNRAGSQRYQSRRGNFST